MAHFILHKFRPTETIDAVLRLRGRHDFTNAQIIKMRKRFNELNGAVVPRAGDVFKIPLLQEVVDDYGLVIDVTPIEIPVEPGPVDDGQEPSQGQHPADPAQPLDQSEAEPVTSTGPENASQQNRNEQVSPDSGDNPSEDIKPKVTQGALAVGGSRRRVKAAGS